MRRTATPAPPRSTAQAAGLTTLIALSGESDQPAELLGMAPVLTPSAATDPYETVPPGTAVTAGPAGPGRTGGLDRTGRTAAVTAAGAARREPSGQCPTPARRMPSRQLPRRDGSECSPRLR
jgi:hypothetical protein